MVNVLKLCTSACFMSAKFAICVFVHELHLEALWSLILRPTDYDDDFT